MNRFSSLLYEDDREEELQKLPVCSACSQPIQDEYCIVCYGEILCEECADYNAKDLWLDYLKKEFMFKTSEVKKV